MNIRHIEIFHAVMGTGSASRAAETLGISQPAVSKAIQELERSVGFLLFDRVHGRIRPTREAQLFQREVEDAFKGMAHLRTAAARIRDFGSGEIRIATLSSHSTMILPQALAAFRRKNPATAITVQAADSTIVRDVVASGEFDIGLAADEIDVTGVHARLFETRRAVIVMPPGHALSRRKVIRPDDLNGIDFVALAPDDTTRKELDGHLAAANAAPRIVLETPFNMTICAMVLAGLGCGLVSPLTASIFQRNGLLVKPFEPAVCFRTLMILPVQHKPSMLVQDCIEELLRFAVFD